LLGRLGIIAKEFPHAVRFFLRHAAPSPDCAALAAWAFCFGDGIAVTHKEQSAAFNMQRKHTELRWNRPDTWP
jgi:hypothetical protein